MPMKTPSPPLALLALCLLLPLLGSGCRTFRGLGQDVQHAGTHIERAARH